MTKYTWKVSYRTPYKDHRYTRYMHHSKFFSTQSKAVEFASTQCDPLGWTKVEKVQTDDTLLADVFSISRK